MNDRTIPFREPVTLTEILHAIEYETQLSKLHAIMMAVTERIYYLGHEDGGKK